MKIKANLPSDWKNDKLGSLCTKLTDGTHKTPDYKPSGVIFISAKNVRSGQLNFSDHKYISDAEHAFLTKRCKPEAGDVMLSKSGSLGDSVVVPKLDFEFSIFESIALIKVKKMLISPKYLMQILNSSLAKRYFWSITTGLAVKHLHLGDLKKMPILHPSLLEQNAITDLLSTWDEAIEKTERLIQAKEMRFKRLLNDLIYLPTKKGKWKQIRTKSLFKERKENKRGDLPLLSITNGEGVIPREDTNRKDTSNKDKSKYLRICPGDIGYNTMRMWQGVSALSSLEGIVSPAYTICIPGEKLHPLFVAYLFKMPFMIHRFYRYSQGLTSDTWNLKFPHFSEVKMPLPSIDEQEQIAETLSSAQHEIDLLKQLAEKYKTQKRGLMQKMLTGEWRVKSDIVNTFLEERKS